MLPHLSPDAAKALREALTRARYTTDGVRSLLGAAAHAALGRGEPEPAHRVAADAGALDVLVRLLLLGSVEPDAAVAAALAPLTPGDAAAAGLLVADGAGWRAALDLRPYGVADGPDWWVLSDLADAGADARRQQRDHVTGVGAASLTLAAATVRRPVGSALDLGTGCGVQALHASRHARRVTGTDVAPRALAHGAGHVRAERRRRRARRRALAGPGGGAPVRPDRVQPAVRARARAGRATSTATPGEDGDARPRRAGRATWPAHLEPGGVAQLLASWLHVRGRGLAGPGAVLAPGRVSTRGWCSARWPTRRCTSAPGSATPGSTWRRPRPARRPGAWLDWLAAQKVEAVGFGLLTLRRTDRRTPTVGRSRTCPTSSTTRSARRSRAGWTASTGCARTRRTTRCSAARLRLADGVLLERYATAGDDGLDRGGRRGGPAGGAAVAARGGRPGRRAAGGLPGRAAARRARGAARASRTTGRSDALVAATLPAVRELVRHGLLVPVP